MQPKEYIKEVDHLLYLPPRVRSQELKNLQQQINAGLDHGYSILNVETWMNPPDETACVISDRHPAYHQSSLIVVPSLLTTAGSLGFIYYFKELFAIFLVKSMNLPDFLTSPEYQVNTAIEEGSRLSPIEGAFLCLLAVIVGIIGVHYFKYTPE